MSETHKNSSIRVGLFASCLVDLFRPQIGFAAADLIARCGCEVLVPEQSCCGQPAYNSGDNEKTRILAQQLIENFEQYDYVVVPSGSCAAMIKVHYPQLFDAKEGWHARAARLGEKTYELSQFLIDVMDFSLTCSDENKISNTQTYGYHDSCSGLRELGVRSQPRQLVTQSTGVVISELDNSEICCGFGGTFCVKYPEISTRMVDNKIDGMGQSDVVLGGDLGCLLNIQGRLNRVGKNIEVRHYAEWIIENRPDSKSSKEKSEP